jgi:hypothetical protein
MLELLERFGSEMRCGGADRLFFDKAAIKRLQLHMGGRRSLRHVEPWLNVYIVVGDNGRLVTAGHRTKRFNRICSQERSTSCTWRCRPSF